MSKAEKSNIAIYSNIGKIAKLRVTKLFCILDVPISFSLNITSFRKYIYFNYYIELDSITRCLSSNGFKFLRGLVNERKFFFKQIEYFLWP